MKKFYLPLLFCLALAFLASCEDSEGPNELGGNTDLSYTKEGTIFSFSMMQNGTYNNELNYIKDSIWIAKNENGIITIKAQFQLNGTHVNLLDSLFGLKSIPRNLKIAVIEKYLSDFGGTMDTSDVNAIKINLTLKAKVTSEGIQDFMYGKGDMSKPFTMLKYSAKLNDKYEFTKDDGTKVTRTVVAVQTTEDWDYGFYRIKTVRVEEKQDNSLFEKITYVANHKFGFVGIIVTFKNGNVARLGFI